MELQYQFYFIHFFLMLIWRCTVTLKRAKWWGGRWKRLDMVSITVSSLTTASVILYCILLQPPAITVASDFMTCRYGWLSWRRLVSLICSSSLSSVFYIANLSWQLLVVRWTIRPRVRSRSWLKVESDGPPLRASVQPLNLQQDLVHPNRFY